MSETALPQRDRVAMASNGERALRVDLRLSRTSWSTGVKIRRGLWTFVIEPSVRWLPKSFAPVRIFFLRAMGARIDAGCMVMPGVRVLMPWNLSMGECSALGEGVNVYNFAPVTIGRHTVVSQFTYLCTGSHDYERPDMPLTFAPIDIGSECWVAADVFVGPGVTISDGAVVGARSVVVRSVPAWTVAAGHPARPIKARVLKASDPEGGSP